jgi:glycosyltransferase involved in cell wall biosynthesis
MDSHQLHRVMLVIAELRCGGAERVVVHLASGLRNLGVQVEIICLQNPGPLAIDAENAGIPVLALKSLRGYDVRAIWQLAKEIRRFRPDVINVHDRSSLPYVALANRLSVRCPIVFSAHGLLVENEQSRLRDRLAARFIANITAVSVPAAQEYARLLNWKAPVHVIDNGVPTVQRSEDARKTLRKSLGLHDDTFVYLAVGNIKSEKGFEDLLTAASFLHHRKDTKPFAVLIAGGVSDPAYHASLLEQQNQQGVQNVVRFLGLCQDTQSLYSAADAFVLSSRKEGLPMVLLEAMSAGLPVIATAVGAVPSVVRLDVDGLVVPPAGPHALADAMDRVGKEPDLRAQIGLSAQQRIQTTYTLDAMARKYINAYGKTCGGVKTTDDSLPTASSEKPRVLMLGPMPPLTGGMATVTCNLRDSELHDWCDLTTMNNGKTTPEGRNVLVGIGAQVKLLWTILSVIRRRKIQIVHIHTCALFSFWRDTIHMIVLRCVGCHVIWHLHDGTFPKFISQGNRFKLRVIHWSLAKAAATIVLSQEALELLRPHAPHVRWQVVLNGVPVPELPSRRINPSCADSSQKFTVLFFGNMTRRKGAYDLIEAVEIAAQNGVEVHLLLGGGEVVPGQRQEIEQRIAGSPCSHQIQLLGLVHGAEKQAALENADCIALPSYAEGLPMALLEGMAVGLPAIASTVGSIPTLVTDGLDGFLAAAGDVVALSSNLQRLAQNPSLRKQMGDNARNRVKQHFSLRAMANRVFQIYISVIAGKPLEP